MIKSRPHLAAVSRVVMGDQSRQGYLRLDLNENPDGLPEDFVQTVLASIDASTLSAYPEYSTLLKKIAAHDRLDPDNICLANGSDSAIKYIFDAFIAPGEKVLLTDPTFAMYPVYSQIFQAEIQEVCYTQDFTFPVHDFFHQINDEIRLAVIINPNNPTGLFFTQDEVLQILKKCAEHDVLLVVDEAYFYYFEQTAIHLIKKYDNLIVLRTFSKLCGLAALRIGYAAASREIITALGKVKPTFDVNVMAARFAEKLLDNESLLRRLSITISQGKEYIETRLQNAGISFRSGKANFILINCNGRVQTIMTELRNKGILVSGGFRQEMLEDYLRVTVGGPETMEKFWHIFQSIY